MCVVEEEEEWFSYSNYQSNNCFQSNDFLFGTDWIHNAWLCKNKINELENMCCHQMFHLNQRAEAQQRITDLIAYAAK